MRTEQWAATECPSLEIIHLDGKPEMDDLQMQHHQAGLYAHEKQADLLVLFLVLIAMMDGRPWDIVRRFALQLLLSWTAQAFGIPHCTPQDTVRTRTLFEIDLRDAFHRVRAVVSFVYGQGDNKDENGDVVGCSSGCQVAGEPITKSPASPRSPNGTLEWKF